MGLTERKLDFVFALSIDVCLFNGNSSHRNSTVCVSIYVYIYIYIYVYGTIGHQNDPSWWTH